jgi:hypothetical protein
MPDEALPMEDIGHGALQRMRRWQYANVLPERIASVKTLSQGLVRFSESEPAMDLTFEKGARLSLRNAMGDAEARLDYPANGKIATSVFRADQIRFRNPKALAYVNFEDTGTITLWATNGAAPPQMVTLAIMSVAYYIPMHIGEKPVSFTQVGNSYSGGGCLVSSHTGNLSYAVDLQITSPFNGDEVIASANGNVSNGASGVTCNRIDTVGCAAYSASCASSWGNWVIISHADGKYTLYAHMENTNYKITRSGPISRGCWMGDEGNTGNTSGSKNGCGDHLHFQWMNSNTTSAASVFGGFQDAPALGSGSCVSQNPVTGIMSCVL